MKKLVSHHIGEALRIFFSNKMRALKSMQLINLVPLIALHVKCKLYLAHYCP